MISPSGDYFLIPDTGQLLSFKRGLLLKSSRACGWSRIGGYLDAGWQPEPSSKSLRQATDFQRGIVAPVRWPAALRTVVRPREVGP